MNNLLSVKQVAFILRVHPLTVRRYINEKKLKAIKVGGNIRVEENAVQEFHKEVTPTEQTTKVFKTPKIVDKHFNHEDPLLRLQGRGAGIVFADK